MTNDIFDISDNTPLVLMKQLTRQKRARFMAKLEYMNPCFSH
ncbi:MAG: cysteine synthase A, partial [Chlorobaculum sp.]|nr:cysteine synthase A [Chlorobaculum sp.]